MRFMGDDLILRNAAFHQLQIPDATPDVPQYRELMTDLDREPGTGSGWGHRKAASRLRTLHFTYSPEEYLMVLDILDALGQRWGLDTPAAVVLEALQRGADTDEP